MDPRRFDTMAKAWARAASRRRLVGGLVGGALAGAADRVGLGCDWLGPEAAAVAHDPRCPPFSRRRYLRDCGHPIACGDSCWCVLLGTGHRTCVKPFGAGEWCGKRDTCQVNRDCGPGGVCIKLDGCCGRHHPNRCLLRCDAPPA